MKKYPEGQYRCEITGQGFDESDVKRTPYFFLDVEPVARLDPDNLEAPGTKVYREKRTVKNWITTNAMPWTMQRLRSLGWTGNDLTEIDAGGSHSFVGLHIRLVCEHDGDYDNFEFPPNSTPTESKAGVAARVQERFSDMTKDLAALVEPTESVIQQPSDDAPDDEDVPF